MNFDKPIDRRNTHSLKWDMMKPLYGVDPEHGTSMWVADMDFEPPAAVQRCTPKNDQRWRLWILRRLQRLSQFHYGLDGSPPRLVG